MNKCEDWNFGKLLENRNFKILISKLEFKKNILRMEFRNIKFQKLETLKKHFENGISKN